MRRANRKRPDADERGYDNEWRKYRKVYLQLNPWCLFCQRRGKKTKATDVDHVEVLRENTHLRFHPGNLRALCHSCHSKRTARDSRWREKEELRIGEDGFPVDPGHPWFRSER